MTALADIQKQTGNSLTMFQRIAKNDQTAIADCVDRYGNLIWALARKFTVSTEEAEIAAREIFTDIWQFAGRFDSTDLDEPIFITRIARRRLIARAPKVEQTI